MVEKNPVSRTLPSLNYHERNFNDNVYDEIPLKIENPNGASTNVNHEIPYEKVAESPQDKFGGYSQVNKGTTRNNVENVYTEIV